MCVAATVRTALARGFRVVPRHDGHATYDIPAPFNVADQGDSMTDHRSWVIGLDIQE